jgi:cytochrome c553
MLRLAQALAALAMVTACTQAPAQMTREQLVERGNYLVNGIGGCNDCHTPMTPQGPDMTHSLQGAPLAFQLLPALEGAVPWAPIAPPIAGLPAGYSEEQFASFLQTGARPDGSHARAPMPQFRLNTEDASAVSAYISTLPRAQN